MIVNLRECIIIDNVSGFKPRSHRKVSVECPLCHETRSTEYFNISKRGHTKCFRCGKIADLTDKRFGRLLVLGLSQKRDKHRGAIWTCVCDCGSKCNIRASSLIQKLTRSCGCISSELAMGRIGSKNPSWNPLLTESDRAHRDFFRHRLEDWSLSVKDRDGFKCSICDDNVGGNLVSHHLNGWNLNLEQRFDVGNGICLCSDCHKEFHGKYGYGNNTMEQYLDFCQGMEVL